MINTKQTSTKKYIMYNTLLVIVSHEEEKKKIEKQ